jgi:prolipoprotein diacylglyceryl transferase
VISTTLAYFPSPAQGVWHLGPIPIRAYALFIIAGIIAALVIGDRRWVARGGERGVIYDIALWAVPFGLIGGRLYHVMTDWKTYFGPEGAGPIAALKIWDGGLGIWGAVALGGVGAWIGCKSRGIPLPAFGDAIAPGIVLAQAIGRLGNYFNQELYGRETTVPWGMEIFYRRDPSGILDVHSLTGVSTGQVAGVVHPTFLYELLWNLLIFVILIYVDRRFKIGHGRLFALYVAGYCMGRFWVELMRDDVATHIAGIRVNSFTSTFVFIGAIVYFILAPKGREDPATLGGKHEGDETVADELAKDLVAAAATTGVVAAATVAGRADEEPGEQQAESPTAAAARSESEASTDDDAAEAHEAVETPAAETGATAPDVEPELVAEVDAEPAAVEAVGDEAPESEDSEGAEPEVAEAAATSESEASTNDDAAEAPEPDGEGESPVVGVADEAPDAEPAASDSEAAATATSEPEASTNDDAVSDQAPEPDVAPAAEAEVATADVEPEAPSETTEPATFESEPAATDADDVEGSPEDEAIVEAEVAAPDAPGVEIESAAVAEDADLIDEDHDPVDDEDLETQAGCAPALGAAVSEQEEELEATEDDDEDEDEDEDSDEDGDEPDAVAETPEPEPLAEFAGVEEETEAEPEPEPATPVTQATTVTTTDSGADTSARRSVWSRLRRR